MSAIHSNRLLLLIIPDQPQTATRIGGILRREAPRRSLIVPRSDWRSREEGQPNTGNTIMHAACLGDASCLLGLAYELGRNAEASEAVKPSSPATADARPPPARRARRHIPCVIVMEQHCTEKDRLVGCSEQGE